MRIPLPRPLFPVYRFFFPVAVFANFGVRVYVSIVTGGSLTTKIIPNGKAVLHCVNGRGFYPQFSMTDSTLKNKPALESHLLWDGGGAMY